MRLSPSTSLFYIPDNIHFLSLAIIRYTFAGCLLIYGCERAELLSVGLVEDELISSLPSR